jgi:hypothetical protein
LGRRIECSYSEKDHQKANHTNHAGTTRTKDGKRLCVFDRFSRDSELFTNFAIKPDFLPGILLTLWLAFLLAVAGIVAVSFLAAFGERGKS